MTRSRILTCCAALSLFLGGWVMWARASAQGGSDAELLKTADELVAVVGKLRGLAPKSPVQKGVRSRDEISRYLNDHVRENFEESEIQAEGLTLFRLGLVPDSIDYKSFVLQLLTEQVAGYYDPDKKTFFIANWLPVDQQRPVMVHELVHALQDQYFDIGRILKANAKGHNDDRSMAQQAVFEGDGMAVMIDYLLQPQGRQFAELPDLSFVMRAQLGMMESQFPVFKKAPAYLKETLLFPYGYGAAFLQKVRASKPWTAVDAIYTDLPESTEQVLHPEKYFEQRDKPIVVEAQDVTRKLGGDWKITRRNVMGEFGLFVLLKAFMLSEEKAAKAAAGWGGDQVLLLQSGTRNMVVLDTVWDTNEEADQFATALGEWLPKRFPQATKSGDAGLGVTLSHSGEQHWFQRVESRVTLYIGVPEGEAAKLR